MMICILELKQNSILPLNCKIVTLNIGPDLLRCLKKNLINVKTASFNQSEFE